MAKVGTNRHIAQMHKEDIYKGYKEKNQYAIAFQTVVGHHLIDGSIAALLT